MATRLYVGNLSFQTSSDDLRDHFAQIGNVESAQVVEDRMTGRSRGFGFVEMTSPEEAAAAIDQLNGKEFGGRNLTVNEARPRTDRGPGGGHGGRGGYGGGGGGYGGGGGRGRDRDRDRRPSRNDRQPRWERQDRLRLRADDLSGNKQGKQLDGAGASLSTVDVICG